LHVFCNKVLEIIDTARDSEKLISKEITPVVSLLIL